MRQNLRASLGAVVLALATLATVIFALINFDQRARFEVVYDGVAWLDTDHGIQASRVLPSSPATRAGIRPGDALLSINSARVTRAAEVARRLDRAGLCVGVPRAVRSNYSHVFEGVCRLRNSTRSASCTREHGAQRLWLCAVACALHIAHEIGIWLSRSLFPGGRACFLSELPRGTFRCYAPAVEMAHWWDTCRQFARFAALYRSLGSRPGLAAMDATLRIKPGANPAVIRICDHPLSTA